MTAVELEFLDGKVTKRAIGLTPAILSDCAERAGSLILKLPRVFPVSARY